MTPSPFELAETFKQDRPRMMDANSDVNFTWGLLMGEVDEARDALRKFNQEGQKDPSELFTELADIILFASDIIYRLGGNTDLELREKVSRNILKYPSSALSNGKSYEEIMPGLKKQWKDSEGDKRFYDIPR